MTKTSKKKTLIYLPQADFATTRRLLAVSRSLSIDLNLIKDLTSLEYFASQMEAQQSVESLKANLVEPTQVNGSLINFVQIDTMHEQTNVLFEVHTKDPLEFLRSPMFAPFLLLFETNLKKFSWSANVPWGSLVQSNARLVWNREGTLVPTISTSKQLESWPEFSFLLNYLERVIRSTKMQNTDRAPPVSIELYHDGASMYFTTKIHLEHKPREALPLVSTGTMLAVVDLSVSDKASNRNPYELSIVGIIRSNADQCDNGILVLQPHQGLSVSSPFSTKLLRGAS